MAGTEREFMSKMDMLPPRDRDRRYIDADYSMRDFWRTNDSDQSHLREMRESGVRGGQAVADMHRLEDHPSLRPYSYGEQGHHLDAGTESVTSMEVARSSLTSSHDVFYTDCHPYHHGNPYNSPSSSSALISAHATYTNFFNPACVDHDENSMSKHHHEATTYMTSAENQYGARYSSLPPAGIPMSHHGVYSTSSVSSGGAPASESINRDMESLRRELAFKCPRSSDLLMAITSTAEATVQEHGSAEDDNDDAPDQLDPVAEHEPDHDLRAAIIDHPYYPEMVVAHIRVFKVGAPRELHSKLDDLTKKFQRFQEGSTMRIGDDPSLDFFMRSYVDLLAKLGEDMEEPFHKFMQFKDATTKTLENICGHYVETGPDESDNYGFDIGPMDGAQDSDELDILGEESIMYSYGDIDESIIIDPSAPDEELRKTLMMKYGRHIGGLKAEFNRVRKKGKLPSNARTILKEWFNRHSYWPYPSEAEKQYLQRLCCLNLKQINNWFINERKRHWSCEGKCMHPNAKFYSNSNGEGKGHQE